MARVICIRCSKEGDSKCPHCRNVFCDEDTPAGMIDTLMSYRMRISEEGILFKRYKKGVDLSEPETDLELLSFVKRILNRVDDAGLKILACAHEFDFAPFGQSSIGCGHRSPEKPLLDFMSDAWYGLVDGRHDGESKRYPHGDAGDKAAAEIIDRALTAIDEGAEFVYDRK